MGGATGGGVGFATGGDVGGATGGGVGGATGGGVGGVGWGKRERKRKREGWVNHPKREKNIASIIFSTYFIGGRPGRRLSLGRSNFKVSSIDPADCPRTLVIDSTRCNRIHNHIAGSSSNIYRKSTGVLAVECDHLTHGTVTLANQIAKQG